MIFCVGSAVLVVINKLLRKKPLTLICYAYKTADFGRGLLNDDFKGNVSGNSGRLEQTNASRWAYYRQQRQLCGRSARTGRWRSTAEADGTIRTCPTATAALPRRLPQLPPRYDRFNRITARRRPPSASAFLDRRSKCLPLGAKLCCNSHFGRVLDP